MPMQFKQILRALGKTNKGRVKLREILFKNRRRMTEREFWNLEYTYLLKNLLLTLLTSWGGQ